MENSKQVETPMCTSTKFDEVEKDMKVDEKKYRGMIEILLYLTTSRPNIMFAIFLCVCFQFCPKKSHLITDILTKTLPLDPFIFLRTTLGILKRTI